MNRQFTYSLNRLYDNSTQIGQLLQDNTYKYDNVGNIDSIRDNGRNHRIQTYKYDDANRLIGSDGSIMQEHSTAQPYGYESGYKYSLAGRLLNKYVDSKRLSTAMGPHIQYLPYDEPYINQRLSGYNERFTFTGKELDEETGYGYFGARYMDHELMTMWLSVDPMSDKYPSISPYAYCAWNPVKLVDPDGRDWYRNDETGSVLWSDNNDKKIDYNGESYRNIGTSYKTYRDGFIFQYGNSIDDVSISEVSESERQFYMDGGQFIPSTFYTDDGTQVNVSFLYNSGTGGNGDKTLNPEMVSALIQAVNIVNNGNDKINKLDISTTTTGKHSKNSSHYICNGARAVDIDIINNTSLRKSSSHSLATKLQCAFDQLGVTNYGPAHNQLQGHDNHIHANIKKKRQYVSPFPFEQTYDCILFSAIY